MNFRQSLLRAVLVAAAGMLVFAGPSFGVRQAALSTTAPGATSHAPAR